jgi:hypothetical protein
MPFKARFQMTVFGSLVLKLYITLVFIREGDLAKLIAEAARARKPVSGRLQKLLRSDFVRYIRNSLAQGTFENAIVGIRFSDGEKNSHRDSGIPRPLGYLPFGGTTSGRRSRPP